jgi:hypothetical protein
LPPALVEGHQEVVGQFGRVAGREDVLELQLELVGWCLPKDGNVVDVIQHKAVGGKVAGRAGVEGFLRQLVSLACRLLARETCCLKVRRKVAPTLPSRIMLAPGALSFCHT